MTLRVTKKKDIAKLNWDVGEPPYDWCLDQVKRALADAINGCSLQFNVVDGRLIATVVLGIEYSDKTGFGDVIQREFDLESEMILWFRHWDDPQKAAPIFEKIAGRVRKLK